jgi:site-specific DNA recombinase
MKAIAYLRVSTQEQAGDDRMSLDIQERDIREHCQRRGHDLLRIYRDPGYSGDSKNRSAFQQMLKDIQADPPDVVVCWRGAGGGTVSLGGCAPQWP